LWLRIPSSCESNTSYRNLPYLFRTFWMFKQSSHAVA
jgi:hypothetical protein